MLYFLCCKESQLHTTTCPLDVPCTELRSLFCFVIGNSFCLLFVSNNVGSAFPRCRVLFWIFNFFFGLEFVVWLVLVWLGFLTEANVTIRSRAPFSPDMHQWLERINPACLSYNGLAAEAEQPRDFLAASPAHLDIVFLFPRAVLVTNSPLMANNDPLVPARLQHSVTHRRKVTKLKAQLLLPMASVEKWKRNILSTSRKTSVFVPEN